eukprot:6323180-Lingulodinium_polyedra.AAC.1
MQFVEAQVHSRLLFNAAVWSGVANNNGVAFDRVLAYTVGGLFLMCIMLVVPRARVFLMPLSGSPVVGPPRS